MSAHVWLRNHGWRIKNLPMDVLLPTNEPSIVPRIQVQSWCGSVSSHFHEFWKHHICDIVETDVTWFDHSKGHCQGSPKAARGAATAPKIVQGIPKPGRRFHSQSELKYQTLVRFISVDETGWLFLHVFTLSQRFLAKLLCSSPKTVCLRLGKFLRERANEVLVLYRHCGENDVNDFPIFFFQFSKKTKTFRCRRNGCVHQKTPLSGHPVDSHANRHMDVQNALLLLKCPQFTWAICWCKVEHPLHFQPWVKRFHSFQVCII